MGRLEPIPGRLGNTRGRRVQTDPDALTPQQEAFIHEYDCQGGNGTRAYLAAYPTCRSIGAAAANAARLLRTTKIRARIDALREARWQRLQMTGDEALARVAQDARADVRELFDDTGTLLAPHLWPDSIAGSVKAVRDTDSGLAVTLNDSLAARRIILEQTGKLRNSRVQAVGELARLLAGDENED